MKNTPGSDIRSIDRTDLWRRRSPELRFQDFRMIARNQVRRDIAEFTPGEIRGDEVRFRHYCRPFSRVKSSLSASLGFSWASIARAAFAMA